MRGAPVTAEVDALDAFLRPRSIAVVGASDDPQTISGLLFQNLTRSEFTGPLLPVNAHHACVQGLAAYPDLASCPVVPELVVACVPAAAVAAVVAQAGDLGVGAVCVISAGFAESGGDGEALQAALVREAARAGVRLIGPNCTGILAGPRDGRFNATFSRTVPPPGRTALVSQSGAVGLAVLEAADACGLGIGTFVSIGNCADVTANDLVLYWGEDLDTDLILLYLESIPEPRRFVQVARAVGERVPIVAVKAGRTGAGRRGAVSHTAALTGGDAAADALLHQAGVIRAASVEELVDIATLLSAHRRFCGRRVAVVTNGGGPGILAADACEASGMEVPEFAEATAARLRSILPPQASVANPVDMIASATAKDYADVVETVQAAGEVDAVVVVYNTPLLTSACDVAAELARARCDTPLVGVFMNRDGPPPGIGAAGVPSYRFPENAARALSAGMDWALRRRRSGGEVLRPDVDVATVHGLVAEAAGRADNGWLSTVDAHALLAAYGVAFPRSIVVRTEEGARVAQAELRCTVVIKVAAAIHKTDVGGVQLNVTTPDAAADAVRQIRSGLAAAHVQPAGTALLVQEQVSGGVEMIVGARRDPAVGALVMVGWGGSLVELLDDVATRVAPLTDADVDEMLRTLRSFPLLTGYRGASPLDVAGLAQLLHAVSALIDDVPAVAELDLNPVFVLEHGAIAADVRIRVS